MGKINLYQTTKNLINVKHLLIYKIQYYNHNNSSTQQTQASAYFMKYTVIIAT